MFVVRGVVRGGVNGGISSGVRGGVIGDLRCVVIWCFKGGVRCGVRSV